MTHGRSWLLLVLVVLMLAGIPAAPALAQTRVVFANESPYDTLDPHAAFDVGRVAVRLNLYDGLYRWLDNPPKLEPWLAESHTVSDDGLNWEFKLRPGLKFHDGSPLTAEDVVYSFRRVLALVWDANPGLTLALAILNLLQGGLPAATVWISKLLIDAVVGAVTTGIGTAALPQVLFLALDHGQIHEQEYGGEQHA